MHRQNIYFCIFSAWCSSALFDCCQLYGQPTQYVRPSFGANVSFTLSMQTAKRFCNKSETARIL